MKFLPLLILLFLLFQIYTIAQDEFEYENQIEIYLIDSYVTPEIPHKFVLSFFTSDSCTSTLLLNGGIKITISETLTDNHSATIDIMQFEFDSTIVPYIIEVVSREEEKFQSERYEVSLPAAYELKTKKNVSIFTVCCFGGVVFLLPSPTLVIIDGENYFGLSKEIPILSFYSAGYNYPLGYAGIEYEYVFNAPVKSIARAGYKHIFQVPHIEYISPGVTGFTNFAGTNGMSAEINFGLARVYNVFTLFAKYRYNWTPSSSAVEMHEISVGLYSNFFSFNL